LQKLDPVTKAKWEDTLAGNNDSLPSWESMARFLEQRCRTLECVDFSLAAYPPANQVGRGRSTNIRSSCMIINARPALCALCGVLAHALPTCPSFLALPLSQRYDEVRRLTRCFVCLEDGHFARGCSAARCPKCNRRHHALLHHCGQLPSSNNSPPLRGLVSAAGVAVAAPPSRSINTILTQDRPTERPTAMVNVRNANGDLEACRLLLDTGSELSYVFERCIQTLGLARTPSRILVTGISSIKADTTRGGSTISIQSRISQDQLVVQAHVLGKIISSVERQAIDASALRVFNDLQLADSQYSTNAPFDILLGSEHVWSVITGRRIYDKKGKLIAISSIFGWVITSLLSSRACSATALDAHLRRFW
ncbi:hypothetical protein KR067_002978, partial [Drosophila pandora]